MEARKIGVNTTYLVKPTSTSGLLIGDIVSAVRLVDDYRPNLKTSTHPEGFDHRYAEINTMGGCIWYQDTKSFSTKEEGNDFFKQLKAEGYILGTEDQFRAFVNKCADLTY